MSIYAKLKELDITLEAVREATAELGAGQVTHDLNVSKVSVVGLGMARQTGVAERMFAALAQEGINIQMLSTSGCCVPDALRLMAMSGSNAGMAFKSVSVAASDNRAKSRCGATPWWSPFTG